MGLPVTPGEATVDKGLTRAGWFLTRSGNLLTRAGPALEKGPAVVKGPPDPCQRHALVKGSPAILELAGNGRQQLENDQNWQKIGEPSARALGRSFAELAGKVR